MEFTLPQLSPSNLKLLFEQAAYDIDECLDHERNEKGEITKYGHIVVVEDGFRWGVTPCNDYDHIMFEYYFVIPDENSPEIVFLRTSNAFDHQPVHCQYKGSDNGEHVFAFINSAIYPDSESVDGKRIIKIFRTFQKMVKGNMHHFADVIKSSSD